MQNTEFKEDLDLSPELLDLKEAFDKSSKKEVVLRQLSSAVNDLEEYKDDQPNKEIMVADRFTTVFAEIALAVGLKDTPYAQKLVNFVKVLLMSDQGMYGALLPIYPDALRWVERDDGRFKIPQPTI